MSSVSLETRTREPSRPPTPTLGLTSRAVLVEEGAAGRVVLVEEGAAGRVVLVEEGAAGRVVLVEESLFGPAVGKALAVAGFLSGVEVEDVGRLGGAVTPAAAPTQVLVAAALGLVATATGCEEERGEDKVSRRNTEEEHGAQ